jgi:hypothetical protein
MAAFDTTRRHVLQGLAFTTLSYILQGSILPKTALAETLNSGQGEEIDEIYHIFVPYVRARAGGEQTITLRSGETCTVKVPYRTTEGKKIVLKGYGLEGNDITVVFHTLYDRTFRIADRVYQEIDDSPFVEEASRIKCKKVYEQIEDAKYISELTALGLLDYVIETSRLEDVVKDRYRLASTNSRLLGMKQAIESTLAKSRLSDRDKKQVRGMFEYVRAGEPVPNFKTLKELDLIITQSGLPIEIQQAYTVASANSRASTVNIIIVQAIVDSSRLTSTEKKQYLTIYDTIRNGQKIPEEIEEKLKSLDSFIFKAEIPKNAKVVYALARESNVSEGKDLTENVQELLATANSLDQLKEEIKDVYRKGAGVVPVANRLLTSAGAEAATGVSLSSLSGAAATNTTLSILGGGSVAAGGLGMLGGLAVATGGAALIGAAGLVSIALVSEMDSEDYRNLGVSVGTGTVAGAATVLAAWTAASALGVTGTLSGAAAITATISALGGLSVMTGGAALIASGTAFLIWSFLEGNKRRDRGVLQQLETRIYTPTEDPANKSLGEFLTANLKREYGDYEVFVAPNIPLDKLSNALSNWVVIKPGEKVLALVDTSYWDDAKEGVAFTENRIIWKDRDVDSISYDRMFEFLDTDLSDMLANERYRNDLHRVVQLSEILDNEFNDTRWVKLFRELRQVYPFPNPSIA